MDRQTLSNYGWIVCSLVVLAILIALATPFATAVADSVMKTTQIMENTSFQKWEESVPFEVIELEARYDFSFYNSLNAAVNDANNDTTANANATKETAVAAIYHNENGDTIIVLLKDTTENSLMYINRDMTLKLGGKCLNLGSGAGFQIPDTVDAVVVDGRLNGSKIQKNATGTSVVADEFLFKVYCTKFTVRGGTYISNVGTVSNRNYVFSIDGGPTSYFEDCTIEASSVSGNTRALQSKGSLTLLNSKIKVNGGNEAMAVYIITEGKVSNCKIATDNGISNIAGVYISKNTNATITNCDINAVCRPNSTMASGIYLAETSTATVTNCDIFADATCGDGNKNVSTGINSFGTLYVNDCDIFGTHSGVNVKGPTYINKGVYKGSGHGGIYFSNSNAEAYVENATIGIVSYQGLFKEEYDTTFYGASAIYIGGDSRQNIKVYINNCQLINRYPTTGSDGRGYAIVLRGSGSEANNTVYLSNTKINATAATPIRVDNNTLKVYAGQNTNITANMASMPGQVEFTNEIYIPN